MITRTFIAVILLCASLRTWAQCGEPGRASWENTWESCEMTTNPNPLHDESHWILYDLGTLHKLTTAHIWNTNAGGQTDRGFRNAIIDYSENGMNWLRLGSFEFPEASGEDRYGGFGGIDFMGRCVRYILITAQDNWGHNECAGLAEVKFDIDFDYDSECAAINVSVQPTEKDLVDMSIFPNPTADWLYVSLEGFNGQATISILTVDGRTIQSEEVVVQGGHEYAYPVQDLPPGTYFVNVQTGLGSTTQRFITIR